MTLRSRNAKGLSADRSIYFCSNPKTYLLFGITLKIVLALVVSAACGCGRTVTNLVSDETDTGTTDSSDAPSEMDSSDAPSSLSNDGSQDSPTETDSLADVLKVDPVLCNNKPCACNNGIDDDADGTIDGFDPECTGAFDDDETSFATGATSANKNDCQDCFFDKNSGHGDDGCQYHSDCLFGNTPSETASSDCPIDCEVSSECVENCQKSTPNGCDCFGCCMVIKEDKSQIPVLIVETCSLAVIDDATKCPRCVQSETCRNECGVCELCPGKRIEDVPERCREKLEETGVGYSCDQGEQVCSATIPCKDDDYYCYQGCCLPIVI